MFKNFFSWLRKTMDNLCDRPDHLQRLSIIGSGIAVYPLIIWLVFIMWKGFGHDPHLLSKQIDWMGWIAMGILGIFALIIVTVLGTIKGIHIAGPGGVDIGIDTTAEPTPPPPSQTITTTTHVETQGNVS